MKKYSVKKLYSKICEWHCCKKPFEGVFKKRFCKNSCKTSYNLSIRRHKRKQQIVNLLGGCCSICGYNKSLRALSFHHVDATTKEFSFSDIASHSLEKLLKEVSKCVLICANCHGEIHEKEQYQIDLDAGNMKKLSYTKILPSSA